MTSFYRITKDTNILSSVPTSGPQIKANRTTGSQYSRGWVRRQLIERTLDFLCQKRVDIRDGDRLGHVSINTTNVCAEVDMEMKAKALATCEVRGAVPPKRWRDDVAMMQFLRSL